MGSEGNFEVSFPKRSTSLLSLKQDLSNHLFFFLWEFLPDFFNTSKPDFKLLCDQDALLPERLFHSTHA